MIRMIFYIAALLSSMVKQIPQEKMNEPEIFQVTFVPSEETWCLMTVDDSVLPIKSFRYEQVD